MISNTNCDKVISLLIFSIVLDMNSTPNNIYNLPKNFKELLTEKAKSLNLCALSIINPSILSKHTQDFQKIITGFPLELSYLKKNIDVQNNPNLILPNCKSILCTALSYNNDDELLDPRNGHISIYASGRDYHKTLKNKLNELGKFIKLYINTANYRAITDSAPFYEQFAATYGQICTKGKNGLVRFKDSGSKIFLAELLLDVCIEESEFCNLYPTNKALKCPPNCKICLNACPTKALGETFNVNKCISFLTIENKNTIPIELRNSIGNNIYGCDACQNACPNNKNCIIGDDEFRNRYSTNFLDLNNLLSITEEEFKKAFAGTPILRIGYINFIRNVIVAAGNSSNNTISKNLLLSHKGNNPIINELVEWALCKLFSKK